MREVLFELLSSTGELSLEVILSRLVAASVISVFIYFSYWFSHSGSVYSKKFNITLISMTLVTTMVMIVIGNNLALSLGMVGALSIVRYRTAVKDTRDTLYIFWTIVVGICCGAGDYRVAAMGSAFVFVMLLIFGRVRNDDRILIIVSISRANEEKLEALIFQRFGRRSNMRVKNTTENSAEFIYEISRRTINRDRKNTQSLTDAVYALGNVEYVNIVSQNDSIGS